MEEAFIEPKGAGYRVWSVGDDTKALREWGFLLAAYLTGEGIEVVMNDGLVQDLYVTGIERRKLEFAVKKAWVKFSRVVGGGQYFDATFKA